MGKVGEEGDAALVWPSSENIYLPKKYGCQSCFFTCDDLCVITEHVEKHVLAVRQQAPQDRYHPVYDLAVNIVPYHRYKYTESDHPPIYPSSSPTLSLPRVKQQARARINEKFEESLNMSPSSSRASSPSTVTAAYSHYHRNH
ncbi:hypothetical protein LOD99_14472 [Oopsacas minuta]|uniref:C2H2-type domain-containing protein n=1 Tax=Oopsacas minuta TaxID=111878 RepID=A0AAV7KEL2_9METZ|nr:hypothetical protein LOD99_14472 [Oopsacas minuta]